MQRATETNVRKLVQDDEHDETELRDYLYEEDIDLDGAAGIVDMIDETMKSGGGGRSKSKNRKRGRPRCEDTDEKSRKRKLATMAKTASTKKLPTTEAHKALRKCLNDDLVNIMLKLEFITGKLVPYLARTQSSITTRS